MSLQVFLQAQILGSEEFLVASAAPDQEEIRDLMGRSAWLTLLCEALPRALLAELKLSRMLLGSSSAEQFLLVLAEEDLPRADAFLSSAANKIATLSHGLLRLVWASTENLGAWPVARKRLDDAMLLKTSAELAGAESPAALFVPFHPEPVESADEYFREFGSGLPSASRLGWSADSPGFLVWDDGQYSWDLTDQSGPTDGDSILFPRRVAMDELGGTPSSLAQLAERAQGAPRWGILRGDVDHFGLQLRRAGSIEDHIHLSLLLKEFFAGELSLLCTLPDFWRKVTILFRGGDDFAIIGSWDALVMLARELHRLFEKFAEQHLQPLPGIEGKTLTMALAIAPEIESSPSTVFQDAGNQLRSAKAAEIGTFQLFGRILEWKRLAEAEELKSNLVRLVREFGCSPEYIRDLVSVYREAFSARASRRGKAVRVDRPWRTYMRVARIVTQARGRDFNTLRDSVITSLIGRRTGGLKLRPSARVALEWARLAAGD